MNSHTIALLATAVTLCSCSGASGPKAGRSDASQAGTPVPFEIIAQTSGWTNLSMSRVAITTEQELTEFWTALARPGAGPPQPEVDFATHIVLAASMGTCSTGGYSIAFKSLVERGGKLVAQVVETSPGDGCRVTQSVTSPAVAILVERHDVTVDFFDRGTVADCR